MANPNAAAQFLESLVGVRIHCGEPDILVRTVSTRYLGPNSRGPRTAALSGRSLGRSSRLRSQALPEMRRIGTPG